MDQAAPEVTELDSSVDQEALAVSADPLQAPAALSGARARDLGAAYAIRCKCWEQLRHLRPDTGVRVPMLDVSETSINMYVALALCGVGFLFVIGPGHWFVGIPIFAFLAFMMMILTVRDKSSGINLADRMLLDNWNEQYLLCRQRLTCTALPLTIMDDALWERFLEGIPSKLRDFLLGRPRSFGERLIQAAALWEMLVGYSENRPDYSLAAVLEYSGRIHRLHSLAEGGRLVRLPASTIRSDTYIYARFAALYDFYYSDAQSLAAAAPVAAD